MAGKHIVPLNSLSEAFELFSRLLIPFVVEVRGEKIYFDAGDFVHIIDDEERLTRVRWIREALINPDEIRKGHLKSKPFREVYIATIYEDEQDVEGEAFIVGVDRRYGRLDFRTAMVSDPHYLKNVKKGKLIWKRQS